MSVIGRKYGGSAMGAVLHYVLSRLVTRGALQVADSKGREYSFGDGSGDLVRVRFRNGSERRVLLNPELKLGEAFMEGDFVVERGSIYEFLLLVSQSDNWDTVPWWVFALRGARYCVRRMHQFNPGSRSRRNVAHHYDLDGRLYELFLDPDQQYSCAYFETEHDTLEAAQLAKKRHLAAKLCLREGQHVLDIGSGWGGLGLYLAEMCPIKVTGVTLSEEQHARSRHRAVERGLAERVDFRLEDYRSVQGPFDRIVSVGMFEHVGVDHYNRFFRKVRDLLTEDGVMMLHAIGRFGRPGTTNPWIEKYIFPGGYIPALSEVLPAIERAGLMVTDVEILRLHYAETLREWRRRFMANWARAAAIYDERFCRMWEFYLAGSEVAFRSQGMMVFQVQLTKRQDAVPLTRNYIDDGERRLKQREGGSIPHSAAAAE